MEDKEEFDVRGMSEEEVAEKMMVELTKCVNCDEKADGVDSIENEVKDGKAIIRIEFTCEYCGCENSPFAEVA